MKLHILTIGKPKLTYAQIGWEEYLGRLKRLHTVRTTHLSDKYAEDAGKIREATADTCVVVLEIIGEDFSSERLAEFLRKRELEAREVSFIIGGPDGLPQEIRDTADYRWSLSRLTFPHDLAMLVTLEALFRASTINAGLPYHR
jgi:23S rRNA (pseudouridine1915-N3)-methyltransferase